MPQGQPPSLQPDNKHSALYFSMFCFLSLLCSAPDVPHAPANSLSLSAGADLAWLSICSLHDFPRTNTRQRLMLCSSARGWRTRRTHSFFKKEEGGWSLLHHPITTDADTENLPREGWTQLWTQASFCTTRGGWDLNHSNIFPAELVPCKSHYPADDTGQFTSHIFCCSVRP